MIKKKLGFVSLSLMLLASLFGCGLKQTIPDVRVYRELPFADSPEALEVWTLKDEYRIVKTKEWEKIRPFMLMIPPETWSAIKKGWLSACRMSANTANGCTHQVESVDNFVKDLDNIVKQFMR